MSLQLILNVTTTLNQWIIMSTNPKRFKTQFKVSPHRTACSPLSLIWSLSAHDGQNL